MLLKKLGIRGAPKGGCQVTAPQKEMGFFGRNNIKTYPSAKIGQ
jgi:hypothetical protein